MAAKDDHWFPAKRHGWGWGMPNAWQGRVVMAVFFVLLLAGAVVLLPRYGSGIFVGYAFLLCVLLIGVCWLKGERPRWRLGKE